MPSAHALDAAVSFLIHFSFSILLYLVFCCSLACWWSYLLCGTDSDFMIWILNNNLVPARALRYLVSYERIFCRSGWALEEYVERQKKLLLLLPCVISRLLEGDFFLLILNALLWIQYCQVFPTQCKWGWNSRRHKNDSAACPDLTIEAAKGKNKKVFRSIRQKYVMLVLSCSHALR